MVGAVGTLHTCLLLSNFQQIHIQCIHVHIHIHTYMYMCACYVTTPHSLVMWLQQVFDELRLQLNETIDSFDYQTDSFLDNETREALTNFSDSRVEAINITG